MKPVFEILKELQSNGSTNFKQEVLEKNKNNKCLKETIRLALDPDINFYIKKIPHYSPAKKDIGIDLAKALNNIQNLSSRKYTGNAAIDYLKYILESLHPANASVIEKVIKRDLDCGFGKTISRRVFPDLFIKHHVMLAQPYNDKNMERIEYPAMIQRKEDGMRCTITIVDGVITWYSRNGKTIDMNGVHDVAILKQIKQMEKVHWQQGVNFVLDGELLVLTETPNSGEYEDRKTGNGILNKIIKDKGTDALRKRVQMVVWDLIDYDEWITGESDVETASRFHELQEFLEDTDCAFPFILTESNIVDSRANAQKVFKEYLDDGHEGVILKNYHAGWKDGRSKDWVKMKNEDTMDLKIVGIKPHKKKPELLGSLECENRDGSIKVSVGSGFNDEDRETINSGVIGKIVTIKYNEKITNKGKDSDSLFLPIFLEIREDKTEADL